MLKFIGTGDMANVTLGNTSAYIKENEKLFLIDCGVTVFEQIVKKELLNNVKEVFICLTHMHPDHIGSLSCLIFYAIIWKNVKVSIIVPNNDNDSQKQEIKNFLSIQGVNDNLYQFVYSNEFKNCFGIKQIKFKEILHSQLKSYALIMEFNNKTIYYLGDNNDANYLCKLINSINKQDLIYTDCTTFEYENSVHISLNTLNKIVDLDKRNQVICMHFPNEDCINECLKLGFNVAEIDF